MRVYTICHSQQSDQGLHYLPFSVWSWSTLFAIFWIKEYTICHSFLAVLSRSALFAILSSLISVFTISHSQLSDQSFTICISHSYQGLLCLPFSAVWSGLHYLLFFLSSFIKVYTFGHSVQSHQGLKYLSVSTVWSGSTPFAILSQIRVYTICHSQQSDQGLHSSPFSAVWLGSTVFVILSCLIRYYTICDSS